MKMTGNDDEQFGRSKKRTAIMVPPTDNNDTVPETYGGADLLARDLTKMSMKEREEVFHDLHGVATVASETPELLARTLAELEVKLAKMKKDNAYNIAKIQNLLYVSNSKFRLKFLRAESFDVGRAADRIVRFFEQKIMLFGPEKLAKDIKLDDLDEGDVACLESGLIQVLPSRDSAGRAILVWSPSLKNRKSSVMNRMRSLHYVAMTLTEDDESQKKGIVMIYSRFGPSLIDHQAATKIPTLVANFAVRTVALHMCYDDPINDSLVAIMRLALEKNVRVRLRAHEGDVKECHYQLMTFGIPTQVLPMLPNGYFPLENHQDWLKKRQNLESVSDNGELRVVVPGPFDILFGREKIAQQHPGNLRYLHIIEKFQASYAQAPTKVEKTLVVTETFFMIKATGAQFLKLDCASWVAVDELVARDKVANAFRSRQKATNRAAKKKEGAKKRPTSPGYSDTSSKDDFPNASKRASVAFSESS